MKFLRRFLQKISAPQTNKLPNILTNKRTPGHHAKFVGFFWILQTPKRVNSAKIGSRKLLKFPIRSMMGN